MDFIGAYHISNLTFLLEGFLVTLKVAAIAIVLSFVIGIIIAIIRYTRIPILSQIMMLFVELIRNLPLILIIFFMFFGLRDVGIKLSVFAAAVVALTIFESALLSEIIRSGLNSIDKGQIEAARSSGLTYIQTLRYIIVPQAIKRMVPPIVGQFIQLLKDTSLAVIISLPEVIHMGQIVYNKNVHWVVPILLFIASLYFVVNYALSIVARKLEAKLY